ncbi:hypothetical protein A9264_08385 [Vibrio sp. UCD-FRSSP16_10]|uniref:TadE/TadG family type IV pilus assembly protein n=1 Tax=unclassified Vibrio TaxID=2614977 RepID=UPI0007FE9E6B|nr:MULTISPECIES: TadE family protein [unclassified Vibrio]OBT06581.1 hypothetical protein A9260_09170 [Vibrio sp. UCD-FRSSP16_30]OBT12278.1 hypothetical protein A9264_08385 [Vibrio sp. UCD-FRSSP16_10]
MIKRTKLKRGEKGLSIIEFTMVSTVLLMAIFAVFELARFVFSLQMLNEVTRTAARLATVCSVTEAKTSGIPSLSTIQSIAPSGYEPEMLKIDYLNGSGVVVYSGSGTITNDEFLEIKFVRAKIEDFSYAFSLLVNVFGSNTSVSDFETILPSESLGIYRPLSDDSVPASPNCK